MSSYFSQGTNTLVVLDHLTAMKDVKGSTGHAGISVWVLTQQITSISKPFCENVAAIVLFYTPSGKSMKAIFEDYTGELSPKEYKEVTAELKNEKFSHLVFAVHHPFGMKIFS